LAVVHLVLGALIAAQLADLCAQGARLFHALAAASHIAGCKPADGRAIHVERDTTRHRLDVLLLQACGRAVVTRICACVAGVDTCLIHLVSHRNLLAQGERALALRALKSLRTKQRRQSRRIRLVADVSAAASQ
jgi:hypothetical protein